MYIGDSKRDVLAPLKSGAKILTGTKTVITNQARNPVNNAKRIANTAVSHLKNGIKSIDPESIELDLIETDLINKDKDGENQLTVDRDAIIQKAQVIIKESMYKPPEMMGSVTMVRNVANPYNPKIKSKSIVDQKDRFKSKNDVYPKVKVDNSIMDKRVRKVRTYLYKVNGQPVARKIEHAPHQPFNPV